MGPFLHARRMIGERVYFDIGNGKITHGEVTGIAIQDIICIYIITLDVPLKVDGHAVPWKTIPMPGGMLRSKTDVLK